MNFFPKRSLALAIAALVGVGCVPMRVPVAKPVETKPLQIEGKKPVPPRDANDFVRIGIRIDVAEIAITSTVDIDGVNLTINKNQSFPAGIYHLSASGDHLLLNGKPVGAKWKFASSSPDVFLKCGTRDYRGSFIVKVSKDDRLTVINELSIDDYLKGVLPREASVSWPDAALRVQAVASRSYLASHLGSHSAQGFDLCSDVHCQVYGGLTNEHPKTNAAVDATHEEILAFEGKPISAYFHSHCGGSTEGVQYVWGTDSKPYLPRKKCTFCKENPRYSWTLTVPASEMLASLKKGTKVKGSKFTGLKVKRKSGSGRAELVSVGTDVGRFELSGNAFRIAMGPEKIRSTLWTDVRRKGNAYTFEGKGWGHGVGMCQWGAKGQADAGRDYREILQFYYPNTTLTKWSRK